MTSSSKAATAVLRGVLGTYLHVEPSGLHLGEGPHKKPFLKDHPLHFNLSHSGDLAAIAVSRIHEVGIDIEMLRPIRHREWVLDGAFTAHEQSFIRSQTDADQNTLIFQGWVRKEACLKALGVGLLQSPRTVDCGFWGERQVCVDESPIRVTNFTPGPGYVGAVARLDTEP